MENNRGVTLISLTIMIVVLLILATVGVNYNSDSIKLAKLTKFITEFEIINTQVSILNQNKDYQSEYTSYGLDSATDTKLITEIDTLLEDKLVNIFNISKTDVNSYKTRFQYCSKENVNEKLGIDGIEGNFLVNIHDCIVISFDGIKYNKNRYYTLEELEEKELTSNTYKVKYRKSENPYIPSGFYYVGGNWDTGYVISDSKDDKYNGNGNRILNLDIIKSCKGKTYMWIPIVEKDESHPEGINWSSVKSSGDYTNIENALKSYKATYTIPNYSDKWYSGVTFGKYAYKNLNGKLIDYTGEEEASTEEFNSIISSIYLSSGLYVKISF